MTGRSGRGIRATVEVLGIRHHGPGSARAVRAALDRIRPDAVLVEGPADADCLVDFVGSATIEPPVALLAYAADDPGCAAFWPFASFSPEWVALRWAVAAGVPVRFCDLPAAATLADDPARKPDDEQGDGPDQGDDAARRVRRDPLAMLADAAGYDDPERWWDDLIESRRPADDVPHHDGAGHQAGAGPVPAPFGALTEAMAELRGATDRPDAAEQLREARREAHMRQVLRATARGGADRIVVVCGAWHAPALTAPLPPAGADARTLSGLPKRRTVLTWVPWTHSRLATASGYGAGVASPGWYHHLFSYPDNTVTRWLTRVAGVLRAEDLPVSSAHVIEAVRLAETLAVLRGRPLAGLAEVTDATRAVLCDGDQVMLDLVTRNLVVGEALGRVPADTPTVPLERDRLARARRLRLKQSALDQRLDLDLRKDTDAARSRLLHRLRLLGVDWGVPDSGTVRGTGTFREGWRLRWDPELSVSIVEASRWGNTVQDAATARLAAATDGTLAELTASVAAALLADLPAALPTLLAAVDTRAARDTDVSHLMAALPALVRANRYGEVRRTDTGALALVVDALLVRIRAALPAAVGNLDDEGSAAMRIGLDEVHEAVLLHHRTDDAAAGHGVTPPAARRTGSTGSTGSTDWLDTLSVLSRRTDLHGLLAGRIVRLLLDTGRLSTAEAGRRLGMALSVGTPTPAKAAWVEGFLSGGGLLLVHDSALLALLDGWVSALSQDEFVDVVALLRRTFAGFDSGERRAIAERVRRPGGVGVGRTDPGWDVDVRRATPAMQTVANLLGVG